MEFPDETLEGHRKFGFWNLYARVSFALGGAWFGMQFSNRCVVSRRKALRAIWLPGPAVASLERP